MTNIISHVIKNVWENGSCGTQYMSMITGGMEIIIMGSPK